VTAVHQADTPEERDRLPAAADLMRDTGRWAAMHGYDAIRLGDEMSAGFAGSEDHVVLNRTALKVVK
jgi:hypothetical protein